jgi:hypothetical protein
MRFLAISLLFIGGCASTLASGPQAARGGTVNLEKCEDLGRVVYNPRNPVLDPTQSTGPSEVVWVHPRPGGMLTVHDGHAYRCGSET